MELSPEKTPAAGAAASASAARGPIPARARGFTLIELLAVIVILGAVLAVVLPRFAGISINNLKTDASRLSTLIRYLNEAAETKRTYYRVLFDMDAGTVSVAESDDASEYAPMAEARLRGLKFASGVRIEDMVLSGLGRVNAGKVTVDFTPSGTSKPFTLHLASEGRRGKEVYTLVYNPYSGRVAVKEGYI